MLLPLLAAATAAAAPVQTLAFVLQNHRFTPAQATVQANRAVEVVLTDKDATPEEFDSDDLGGVEEVVHPGQTIRFRIGPLKPGAYSFMGERHADTAQGVISAR